jgi:two-component system NtrC family sensor kinase
VFWLSIGLGYAVVYAIAGLLLSGTPAAIWLYGIGVLIPAVLAIVSIVRRSRDWAGCQWLFWATIAAGFSLWVIGHVGWALERVTEGPPLEWLSWHTAFSLSGGVAPLLALLARPQRGPRHGALATTAVDIAGFAIITAFAYAYFINLPSLEPSHAGSAQMSLLIVIQVQRFALLAAMLLVGLRTTSPAWRRTYWRLAAGYGVGFLIRGVLSLAIVRGTYEPGSFYDLAWIAPFFFTLWAIAEAPASEAEKAAPASRPSDLWLLTIGLAMVPVVGYGGYYLFPLGSPTDNFRVLLTTVTTIAGLALLTARTIVQGAELRRADDRLRLLASVAQQTGDQVLVFDRTWRVQEANDAAVAALGYTREELARLTCPMLTADDSHEAGRAADRALQANETWRGTLKRRRKDGSAFPASCTIGALRNEAGVPTHFVAVERDATDELRLRDQIISSERLAAVAEVVSGVAHEINNPLQAIMGCTELLLDSSTSAQSRRDLETVRNEAARAGQIVRNLLGFVHRGPGEREVHDVNAIVQKIAALRVYHLRQIGIELDVRSHPEQLPARVNRDEIQQVLLNLLLNAEHAISGSGRGSRITLYTWRDAHGIAVQVADDGPGVPSELRGRIFEPFFTTRQVGEGSGLGLSISLGIALAHGGRLEFAPSPDGGASFRLTLPPFTRRDRPATALNVTPVPPGSGPRALVIDDEEAVRLMLVRMLERRGYAVAQAGDADAALALLGDAPVDVVLCDAQLPRLPGTSLFARASARRPQLHGRFVLISEDGAPIADAAERAGLPLLSKPFTSSELDAVLDEIGR